MAFTIGTHFDRAFRQQLQDKINSMDVNNSKAVDDSTKAKTDSAEALTKANQAKTTADQVRTEFDNVIAEAGSNNPEVVQARGEFVNLNARLNSTAESLAQTDQQLYASSLDQKNKLNVRSVSRFMTKLKNGVANFAILGDSITDTWAGSFGAGGGASDAAHGYPQVLHTLLKAKFGNGIQFTNRGFGGQNTFAASGRFDTEIKPYNYDCIGIALGTNDWNQQGTLINFESVYRQLIERCINETNADIFLVGLGYFADWKPEKTIRETAYNAVIKKLASEYDLCFIDTRAAMMNYMKSNGASFGDITYTPDPVHPNDLGHEVWAKAVFDVFDRYNSIFEKPFRDNSQFVHHALDGDILFSGNWVTEGPYSSVFRSYIKSTSTVGSFCVLDFIGTDVDLYFVCDTNRSTDIDIYIDGELYLDGVSTYSAAFAIKRIQLTGLKNVKHTVKIVNNVSVKLSLNYIVTYSEKDINVIGSMKNKLAPRDIIVNDHFNAFDTNVLYLFGEALYVAPTSLTNKYVNTGFLEYFKSCRIIYTKAPAGGIIEVYLDGSLYTTVDTYSSSFVRQSEIVISANKLDYHSVIIKVKDKNASASAFGLYIEGVVFDNVKETNTTGADNQVFNYNFYATPTIQLTPTFNGSAYVSAVTKKQATVRTNPAGGSYMITMSGIDIS